MTAVPFAATAVEQPTADSGRALDAAGFATFPLAGTDESPRAARRATAATLRGWGLDAAVDDAAVVVSELVTNAVRYGLPAAARHPIPPATPDRPILLGLVHCGGWVLCAVSDPGEATPRLKEPDFLRESGRGLHVLESLAQRWGWTTPDRHGKAVWALLPAPGDPPGTPDVEPLTRLLLLLELLNAPTWLTSLGTSVTTRT
ncbi:ATP-binding protein [Streptomyces sp. DSM 44917]|uniref:ATP-binding protein n=1 Tax=Streptomyces boetiae TaxID=3075541 RepID=A0ABU2L4T2_9ACTN|nr:ATP-binding protein [Streptomyces sp. DSM 44917]MDT0306522.1 ATP-binding protein [Streptomyces sp. DSM 44917]